MEFHCNPCHLVVTTAHEHLGLSLDKSKEKKIYNKHDIFFQFDKLKNINTKISIVGVFN